MRTHKQDVWVYVDPINDIGKTKFEVYFDDEGGVDRVWFEGSEVTDSVFKELEQDLINAAKEQEESFHEIEHSTGWEG